jgi:hypothetical protein
MMLRWSSFDYQYNREHPKVFSGNLPKVTHEFIKGRKVDGRPVCKKCGMYEFAYDYMGRCVHHA